MIKRILVGLCGTPATHSAVECSINLARRHGAKVTGVAITDVDGLAEDTVPVPIRYSPYARHTADSRVDELRARANRATEEFARSCRDAQVPHEEWSQSGNPLAVFTGVWRYHDLAVLALRGFFEYGLVPEPHDAIYDLFSQGVRPIIAVAERPRTIRRALIAYHGEMGAAKAMKRFVQLRLWPDLELHVACFEKGSAEAKDLLRDAADYCRAHGFEPQTHHDPASAHQALLPLAMQIDADIIVMGSRPRSLLARKLLGDTLLTAIRHADRPLFLSH